MQIRKDRSRETKKTMTAVGETNNNQIDKEINPNQISNSISDIIKCGNDVYK